MSRRSARSIVLAAVLGLLVAAPAAGAAPAPTPSPSPKALSAGFWQWAHSIPYSTDGVVTHPLLTDGAVDCTIGQSGDTWFLGGTFGSADPVRRSCTVPSDVRLYLPVYNAWVDNSNCDGLPRGTFTTEELRGFAADSVDQAKTVSASVDGSPLQVLKSRRVQSRVFSYTTPTDSLIDALFCSEENPFSAQTVKGAVADAIAATIPPLTPGRHLVRWKAKAGDGSVLQDVIYRLTVTG